MFLMMLFLIQASKGNVLELKSKVDAHVQSDEVLNLLKRNFPNHFHLFDITIDRKPGILNEVVHIRTYHKDGQVKVLEIEFCS